MKGFFNVKISYKVHPMAHMSAFYPYISPKHTSGLMK